MLNKYCIQAIQARYPDNCFSVYTARAWWDCTRDEATVNAVAKQIRALIKADSLSSETKMTLLCGCDVLVQLKLAKMQAGVAAPSIEKGRIDHLWDETAPETNERFRWALFFTKIQPYFLRVTALQADKDALLRILKTGRAPLPDLLAWIKQAEHDEFYFIRDPWGVAPHKAEPRHQNRGAPATAPHAVETSAMPALSQAEPWFQVFFKALDRANQEALLAAASQAYL